MIVPDVGEDGELHAPRQRQLLLQPHHQFTFELLALCNREHRTHFVQLASMNKPF